MNAEAKIDEIQISAMPPNMVDIMWSTIKPFFEKIRVQSPLDVDLDVTKQRIRNGDQLIILVSKLDEIIAVNLVDVKTLDSGVKILYIPFVSGKWMNEWAEKFIEAATQIARDYDCVQIRGLALRKGLIHKLHKYGFEPIFTTLKLDLGDN